MNGNNPYAGRAGVVEAGRRTSEDRPEFTREQRRTLQRDVAAIAARTRDLLPGEYAIGSEITRGVDGPRAQIAVRPPVGNPVSAGFEPDLAADPDSIADEERAEVARGLAASAALQVKQALAADPDVTPAAR